MRFRRRPPPDPQEPRYEASIREAVSDEGVTWAWSLLLHEANGGPTYTIGYGHGYPTRGAALAAAKACKTLYLRQRAARHEKIILD